MFTPRHKGTEELLRVIKLGGSLLDFSAWPQRLLAWRREQPSMRDVLIVGGGALADGIRQLAQTSNLDEETAHWQCIDALAATAATTAKLLVDFQCDGHRATTLADVAFLATPSRITVFDPRPFLQNEEASLPGTVLPHTWAATSDSITARLAVCAHASELVLLKSCDPPGDPRDLNQLADAGYVDRHFPIAAAHLAVRFVNLRSFAANSTSPARDDGQRQSGRAD